MRQAITIHRKTEEILFSLFWGSFIDTNHFAREKRVWWVWIFLLSEFLEADQIKWWLNRMQSSLLTELVCFWTNSYNSYEFIKRLLLFGDFLEELIACIMRVCTNFHIHFSSNKKPIFYSCCLWRKLAYMKPVHTQSLCTKTSRPEGKYKLPQMTVHVFKLLLWMGDISIDPGLPGIINIAAVGKVWTPRFSPASTGLNPLVRLLELCVFPLIFNI